jgi:amino acid permease
MWCGICIFLVAWFSISTYAQIKDIKSYERRLKNINEVAEQALNNDVDTTVDALLFIQCESDINLKADE